MKQSILLLLTILLLPNNVFAQSRSGYSRDVNCYKDVYREEYIPGTKERPGYVRRYTSKKQIPCGNRRRPRFIQPYNHSNNSVDDNSCIEGSILGGILGGGAGAIASRGDGRLWAIPLGVVGGALVGCQVDGG